MVCTHQTIPFIRKTCPCNKYPLKPHFYIVKLGYAEGYLFLLFLLQKSEAVLTCTHNQCFEQNKKNIKIFQLKNFQFLKTKKIPEFSILHGQVFVIYVDNLLSKCFGYRLVEYAFIQLLCVYIPFCGIIVNSLSTSRGLLVY